MRFLFIVIIALGFVSCKKEIIKPNTFATSNEVTNSTRVNNSLDVVTIELYTSAPVSGQIALYRYNDIDADTIVDLSAMTPTITNMGDINYYTYTINVNYTHETVINSDGRFYVEALFNNYVDVMNTNKFNGKTTFNGNELLLEPATFYKENTNSFGNSFYAKYKKKTTTTYNSNNPTM